MNFERPPAPPDDYADDLREMLGLNDQEYLLLQPTRVVPRKCIEVSIQLACWLDVPCSLLIPHDAGDEGVEYQDYLIRLAKTMGVPLLLAADRFAPERGQTPSGEKIYGLADAYQQANLVTYPSAVEGFGNAFLETIFYKKPLVMSGYEIFKTDIQPKGFDVVVFEGFINDLTLQRLKTVLLDDELVDVMTERNYELARRHYSYPQLRALLSDLVNRGIKRLY
jgi:glycosyltransferase involved in cell wall biosynthesis